MTAVPPAVLFRWARFAAALPRPFGTGLINKTFLVQAGGARAVLQRLHPVFAGSVNEDIDAVTSHLASRGLLTPRLLRTDDGAPFVTDDEGRPWRLLSYVDGESVDKVDSPARARAGALLVARFHRAVADLPWQYRHVRSGVHDTDKHRAHLRRALDEHPRHRLFAEVAPLAAQLLNAPVPALAALPERHCHGDLKISNLLFARGTTEALCLVDLDTLGKMAWPHEMGDALRSWCNPGGEDVTDAALDVQIFTAAVEGYAEAGAGFLQAEERARLVDGLFTICVELACRFLADALFESYFGWDERRYDSRGAHNLVRARGQWQLASSVAAQRARLQEIVDGTL